MGYTGKGGQGTYKACLVRHLILRGWGAIVRSDMDGVSPRRASPRSITGGVPGVAVIADLWKFRHRHQKAVLT